LVRSITPNNLGIRADLMYSSQQREKYIFPKLTIQSTVVTTCITYVNIKRSPAFRPLFPLISHDCQNK